MLLFVDAALRVDKLGEADDHLALAERIADVDNFLNFLLAVVS